MRGAGKTWPERVALVAFVAVYPLWSVFVLWAVAVHGDGAGFAGL
jgi:hypothetical protein